MFFITTASACNCCVQVNPFKAELTISWTYNFGPSQVNLTVRYYHSCDTLVPLL